MKNTTYQNHSSALCDLVLKRSGHLAIVNLLQAVLTMIEEDQETILINWHPLGFLQFKLGRFEDETSLKLHIWDDELRKMQDPAWLVHRHEWDLTSHVICGQVTNYTYQVGIHSYQGRENERRIYEVSFDGQDSILEQTNDFADYEPLNVMTYQAGQKYDVLSHEYHATLVAEGTLACTIAASTCKVVSSPFVLGDPDGENTYTYHRAVCPRATWQPILMKVIKQIAAT